MYNVCWGGGGVTYLLPWSIFLILLCKGWKKWKNEYQGYRTMRKPVTLPVSWMLGNGCKE
jgi:hypothetical protein